MPTDHKLKRLLANTCSDGFFVGGCVRDAVMGRQSGDIDIAVGKKEVRRVARALAKELNGCDFVMDEENVVMRVTAKDPQCQIDISAMQGTLEADLGRRDFTLNALAYPIHAPYEIVFSKTEPGRFRIKKLDRKRIVDLSGGLEDIAKKRVAPVSDTIFSDDPLRLLRAYRIAAELGFGVSQKTLRMAKRQHTLVTKAAAERLRDEFTRLLAQPQVRKHLRALDRAGLLGALIPELQKQKGCAPQYYGGLGVFSHTLAVCDRLEYLLTHTDTVFPEIHNELEALDTRPGLLQLVALLHDISKPETAKVVGDRLRFFHHEARGARRTEEIMRGLRFSRAEITLASKIIGEHLRPGNLSANRVITPRAVYRFFTEMGDAAIPMLLVCWADYASYIPLSATLRILPETRQVPAPGDTAKNAPDGIKKTLRHMQVINLMLRMYFKNRKTVLPQRLISGHDLITEFGMKPGPEIGKVLELVRIAQAEGKVTDRAGALDRAGRIIGRKK